MRVWVMVLALGLAACQSIEVECYEGARCSVNSDMSRGGQQDLGARVDAAVDARDNQVSGIPGL